MADDDIAGGGDEVWEQAISELKKRFTFGRWEQGEGIFGGREVVQAADGSMRVGQPVFSRIWISCLSEKRGRDNQEMQTKQFSARNSWVFGT